MISHLSDYFLPTNDRAAGIEASQVCKAYGPIPVLFPLSFSLDGGAGLAVLGPNGSGKTTLLRLVAGLIKPTAGSLSVVGYSSTEQQREVRSMVGLVGHDTYLYDDLTGFENLRFAANLRGCPVSDLEIAQTLELVGLGHDSRQRVKTYSSGMKRRLGLVRLLLFQPPVILLDEPHTSLDTDGQALVDAIVEAARASGRTVIIASHDHERALGLCDRVLVMDRGHASYEGLSVEWLERRPLWVVGNSPS